MECEICWASCWTPAKACQQWGHTKNISSTHRPQGKSQTSAGNTHRTSWWWSNIDWKCSRFCHNWWWQWCWCCFNLRDEQVRLLRVSGLLKQCAPGCQNFHIEFLVSVRACCPKMIFKHGLLLIHRYWHILLSHNSNFQQHTEWQVLQWWIVRVILGCVSWLLSKQPAYLNISRRETDFCMCYHVILFKCWAACGLHNWQSAMSFMWKNLCTVEYKTHIEKHYFMKQGLGLAKRILSSRKLSIVKLFLPSWKLYCICTVGYRTDIYCMITSRYSRTSRWKCCEMQSI